MLMRTRNGPPDPDPDARPRNRNPRVGNGVGGQISGPRGPEIRPRPRNLPPDPVPDPRVAVSGAGVGIGVGGLIPRPHAGRPSGGCKGTKVQKCKGPVERDSPLRRDAGPRKIQCTRHRPISCAGQLRVWMLSLDAMVANPVISCSIFRL